MQDDEDEFPRDSFCDVRFDRIPKGSKKPPEKVTCYATGKIFCRSHICVHVITRQECALSHFACSHCNAECKHTETNRNIKNFNLRFLDGVTYAQMPAPADIRMDY